MLDIIEKILTRIEVKFQRIDGKSTLPERKSALDCFNSDSAVTIMLATVGAVGEG